MILMIVACATPADPSVSQRRKRWPAQLRLAHAPPSSVNSGSKRPKPLRQPGTARPGGARIPAWRDVRRGTTGRSGVAPLCLGGFSSCRPGNVNLHFRNALATSNAPQSPLVAFIDWHQSVSVTASRTMQPWSPPENGIVLTDLLRSSPPSPQLHQQRDVFVKQEPHFVSSRPGIVELPPLLPPRATMLPAFSDVLRTTTSPQQRQQQFQYENQENSAVMMNAYGAALDKNNYTSPTTITTEQYLPEPTTFSATFMTRPNATDYRKNSGIALPSLPRTTSPYATGDMTPPGLVGARTRPLRASRPSPREATSRPVNRTCRFAGCTHYVVDHGLCVRHGGGKRCTAEGCTARAKHFNRCWRHGGSIECKAPGCSNRAKSRGFCWSHGGGTKCKTEQCEKIAISNGLCWAHGGGKRCIVPGCRKQAYERTCNYCNSHFQQYQQTAFELARHNPSA